MAKEFLEIYLDSAETAYSSGATPIVSIAKLNEGVKFIPMPSADGKVSNQPQFHIQRLKRQKAKTIASTGKLGDDMVARMNAADPIEWDTVNVSTGNTIYLQTKILDKAANEILANIDAYAKVIADFPKNRLLHVEELAIEKLIAGQTPVDADLSTNDKFVEQIEGLIDEVKYLVDDFKFGSNPVVFIHPKLARIFAKVEGKGYSLGTNTFPNGAGQSFTYDGIEFYAHPQFNSIETVAGKTVGAIIMDREAFASAGVDVNVKEDIKDSYGDTVIGVRFSDLSVVIDTARIKVVQFTNSATKKVNA